MRKIIFLLFFPVLVYSQTFLLNPTKGYFPDNPDILSLRLLFPPTDSLIFSWQKQLTTLSNYKLLIGQTPGVYDLLSIPISGTSIRTIPNQSPINLSTGRYYCIVTNSNEKTLGSIIQDFANNPTQIGYTNQIQFIVESNVAPLAITPEGFITDPTPVFEWTSVPGVPAYYLILSNTPFTVVSLPNGEISVEGANILWSYRTTETSVLYGEPDPGSPYFNEAPPLIPGFEYNYTIINMYDEEDISFASSVFGGAVSFTYVGDTQIEPPILITPADSSVFYGDELISFSWETVNNAVSYTIYLFQTITSFGGNNQEINIPIWFTNTTSNSIDFPARTFCTKSDYLWFVAPNSSNGAGNISEVSRFKYVLDVGRFQIQALSANNGLNLLNYEVQINSISGGISIPKPLIVTNSQTYTDSLPVGLYEFRGSKPGYYDSTIVQEILKNVSFNFIDLVLRPYPSLLTGNVIDNNNYPIQNATVKIKEIFSDIEYIKETNSFGQFSIDLPEGSYSVYASKEGYLSSSEIDIGIEGGQVVLPEFLVLIEDIATVSGKVINDENEPIQLATVKAVQDNTQYVISTDISGNYNFTLNSGNWELIASKNGFISSIPSNINLESGENLTDEDLMLIPKANQLSGFTFKSIAAGSTPLNEVKIKAIPLSGEPITTLSSNSGQFQLSLNSGSYTLKANKQGYTSTNNFQLNLGVGQTVSGMDFYLTPNPSVVTGTVKSNSGDPISGVKISSETGEFTNTIANGSYSLSLPEGVNSISASKNGFLPPALKSVQLQPGQTLTGIDFVMLPNAASISGKVTSSQKPIIDAKVVATNSSDNFYETTTNDEGNYSFSLLPGSYSLKANKQGFLNSEKILVNVSAGQLSSGNNFQLIQNICSVNGLVTDIFGNPIKNQNINIKSTDNTLEYFAITNNLGEFSISIEAQKIYNITISKEGYVFYSITTQQLLPDKNYNFDIILTPQTASIKGICVDEHDKAVSGAEVIISSIDGSYSQSVTTNTQGQFYFGLNADDYKLKANKSGYLSDSLIVTLSPGQNIENAELKILNQFATIYGTVFGKNNLPLQGAFVQLNGNLKDYTISSNDEGNYLLEEIISDIYTISVTKLGYQPKIYNDFPISENSTISLLDTLMDFTGSISGIVTDINSFGINNASVLLISLPDSNEYLENTDETGNYLFSGLNLGNYSLYAIKSGYSNSETKNVTISTDNQNIQANLSGMNKYNSTLSGTIRDNNSLTISGAEIKIKGSNGSASTFSNNVGSFLLDNLSDGNYNLTVKKSGYKTFADSIFIESITEINPLLYKNNSFITGTVVNQFNMPLGFSFEINAFSETGEVYKQTVDLSGKFSIANVPAGDKITINSKIFREGFVNDTIIVETPPEVNSSVSANLIVFENNSSIYGNTDAPFVNLRITDQSGKLHKVISNSNGNFEKKFLPEGNYLIKPSLLGYTFEPIEKQIFLQYNKSFEVNFTAIENNGNLTVNCKDNLGKSLEEISVSIFNASANYLLSKTSNAEGIVSFTKIPVGNYKVTVESSKYTSETPEKSIEIKNGFSESLTFSFTENNSVLRGWVYLINNGISTRLNNATISLKYLDLSKIITLKSSLDGYYQGTRLQEGNAEISCSYEGLEIIKDTLFIPENDTLIKSFTFVQNSINLRAYVIKNGAPLEGANVTAIYSGSESVSTNSLGQANFLNIPVFSDSISLTVKLDDPNYPAQTRVVTIKNPLYGNFYPVDTFFVASSSIKINVLENNKPLNGVLVSILKPSGESVEKYSGIDGSISTRSNLSKGTYELTFIKKGFMLPKPGAFKVILPNNRTQVVDTVSLNYSYNHDDSLFSDQPFVFNIESDEQFSNQIAKLFYRQESESGYNEIVFNGSDKRISASIPALLSSEDITFYAEIFDSGNYFYSEEKTFSPLERGLLSTSRFSPALNNKILRLGDVYRISTILNDALSNTLNSEFTGENPIGKIYWNINPSQFDIAFPFENNPTIIEIIPKQIGDFSIGIEAELNSNTITFTRNVQVTDVPVKNISVQFPETRLSNTSKGLSINISGVDTLNRNVLLGRNISFEVVPSAVAKIENSLFIPTDTSFIGNVTVFIFDEITGTEKSTDIKIFAQIFPDRNYYLSDRAGFNYTLSKNSVPFQIELNLEKISNGPSKKQFTPLGESAGYIMADELYRLSYSANLGIPGDSLLIPAIIEIPNHSSLNFFAGERYIGLYNNINKSWNIFSGSNQLRKGTANANVNKFGEYSDVVRQEPLSLKYLSVLPSPFSPEVSNLKIGYFLTTPQRQAQVTINIYNVLGELVRTVLEDDFQISGKYGSRTGEKIIEWDGKTNSGLIARNGRYIIEIKAKDSTGEVNEYIQVVLVK